MSHDDELPYSAAVSTSRRFTPHMQRITVTGAGGDGFTSSGRLDERLLVGFPPDRKERRSYTVRKWDADRDELTLDVVVHPNGHAARWAAQARPGEVVRLSRASGWYSPPPDTQWQLLLADMTALPAVGRILENLPARTRAWVIAEVPESADEQRFDSAAEVTVTWLHGHGNGTVPSALASAAHDLPLPDGTGYVWFGGEARTSRQVRRWLRHDLGWSSERYHVLGYWRERDEEWTARYERFRDDIEAVADRAVAEGNDLDSVRDAVDAAMDRAGL